MNECVASSKLSNSHFSDLDVGTIGLFLTTRSTRGDRASEELPEVCADEPYHLTTLSHHLVSLWGRPGGPFEDKLSALFSAFPSHR